MARAAIEGMFGGLADAVDALVRVGVSPTRILLVGGAAANPAVGAVAATLFDVPVVVPPPGEYVADGAARQAAWVLAGGERPPAWRGLREGQTIHFDPTPVPAIRDAYARARTDLFGG
jgi:xylulokinase